MALTAAQLNSHLRQIVLLLFDKNEEALDAFARACVYYSKNGNSADKEAARTILKEVYARAVNRPLTSDDLHHLIHHKVGDKDSSIVGDF